MATKKAAKAAQPQDTPAEPVDELYQVPEGKLRLFPFIEGTQGEHFVDIPEPPGIAFGALYARQYSTPENAWYLYDKEHNQMQGADTVWQHDRMKPFIPDGAYVLPPALGVESTQPAAPEAPAPAPSAGVVAPKPGFYPEMKETRFIKTALTSAEIEDASRDMATIVLDIEQVKADKKAASDKYAARITDLEKRQKELARLINDGEREKRIECEWLYECTGLDADKRPVHHPNMKALIRLDERAIVDVRHMTEEDFNRRQLLDENQPAPPPPAESSGVFTVDEDEQDEQDEDGARPDDEGGEEAEVE